MPAVTLIIPVYNTAKYLKRCLDSILSQTFQNFDILCINDGSTDNSLEILQYYSLIDHRIKIISQNNQGLSRARNRGILEATGIYIMFVDSDDTIEPTMIETLYQTIRQEYSDIVMGGYKHLDATGNIQKFSPAINDTLSKDAIFHKVLANEVSSSPCICIYSKKLFSDNHLFFTNHLFFEDAEFQYKAIFYAKSVCICNEPLYNYYHLNEGSITNTISFKHIEDLFFIFDSTKAFLTHHKLDILCKNSLHQRVYNYLKYLLNKIGSNDDTTQHTRDVLESIWEHAVSSSLFQKLSTSKKLHLVYLTLIHFKNFEYYDFFKYFNLSKEHIQTLQRYTQSPLGLMEGAIEYFRQNLQAKSIYIYGASDILNILLPIFDELHINILGIIDKKTKRIQYNKDIHVSRSVHHTPLKDNDMILVTSITHASEIEDILKTICHQRKINIDFITYEQLLKTF